MPVETRVDDPQWLDIRMPRVRPSDHLTFDSVLDKRRKAMTMWFQEIFDISLRRTQVSGKEFQRVMGFGPHKTGWTWLHKLHAASRCSLPTSEPLHQRQHFVGRAATEADSVDSSKYPVPIPRRNVRCTLGRDMNSRTRWAQSLIMPKWVAANHLTSQGIGVEPLLNLSGRAATSSVTRWRETDRRPADAAGHKRH